MEPQDDGYWCKGGFARAVIGSRNRVIFFKANSGLDTLKQIDFTINETWRIIDVDIN